jgi:hypothetical protein
MPAVSQDAQDDRGASEICRGKLHEVIDDLVKHLDSEIKNYD